MFSSSLLLFGHAAIFPYVIPRVHSQLHVPFKPELVKQNEIPYQIILQNVITGKYFCGGCLINPLYVLTAAQCVKERSASEILVHAGAIRIGNKYRRVRRSVREIIVHGQYNPHDLWRNDIVLLRLEKYIRQGKRSRSLLPVEQGTQSGYSIPARVFRYGIISENQEPTFQRLKQHYTYLSARVYCYHVYKTINYNITDNQICARDSYDPYITKKRINDTNGPLIVNRTLFGIASSSHMCFLKNIIYSPVVFTSISSFIDWIWRQMLNRVLFDTDS